MLGSTPSGTYRASRALASILLIGGLASSGKISAADRWVEFETTPTVVDVYLEGGLSPKYLGRAHTRLFLKPKEVGPTLTFRLRAQRPGHKDLVLQLASDELDQRHVAQLQADTIQARVADIVESHPVVAGCLLAASIGLIGLGWTRVSAARSRAQRLDRESLLSQGKDDIRLGSVIAKHRLVRRLGSGGMGSVYWAVPEIDLDQSKAVAIKLLKRTSYGADTLERFRRECAVSGRLSHPGMIRILDFGDQEGTPYLMMEALQGRSLEDALKSQMLIGEVWRILRSVLQALVFAHDQQLVHRDIKPENIFVCSCGAVKLLDFGLARSSFGDTASVAGTPGYLAPEVLVDPSTGSSPAVDQFALGVTLYRCLTGELPTVGTGFEQVKQLVLGEGRPLGLLRPDLPDELQQVLQRMMHPNPKMRYPTIRELLVNLEPVMEPLGSSAAGRLSDRGQAVSDEENSSGSVDSGKLESANVRS